MDLVINSVSKVIIHVGKVTDFVCKVIDFVSKVKKLVGRVISFVRAEGWTGALRMIRRGAGKELQSSKEMSQMFRPQCSGLRV